MTRLAGQYTDAESGLVYMRARYYDPATAQFISRDPITAITQSPYGYVDGDPLNGTDPTGLCPWGMGELCHVAKHDVGRAAHDINEGVQDFRAGVDQIQSGTVGICVSGEAQALGGVHGSVCLIHTPHDGFGAQVSGGIQAGPSVSANVTGGLMYSSAKSIKELNANHGSSFGVMGDAGEGAVISGSLETAGCGKQSSVNGYLGAGVGGNWTPPALPITVDSSGTWSHAWSF